jgi:hypothetical protein
MQATYTAFGQVEIDGELYGYDVVVKGGKVSKRKKKASKPFWHQFNHTPLSIEENIPWGGEKLIVGTGMHGALPVMDEVYEEAARRGVEIIAVPTVEACRMIAGMRAEEVYAVLHVTC